MPIPSEPKTVGFTHGYLLSPLPGINPLCGKLWVSLTRMPVGTPGPSTANRGGRLIFDQTLAGEGQEFCGHFSIAPPFVGIGKVPDPFALAEERDPRLGYGEIAPGEFADERAFHLETGVFARIEGLGNQLALLDLLVEPSHGTGGIVFGEF